MRKQCILHNDPWPLTAHHLKTNVTMQPNEQEDDNCNTIKMAMLGHTKLHFATSAL